MSRKCGCSPLVGDHIAWLCPIVSAPLPPELYFIHRNMFCEAWCVQAGDPNLWLIPSQQHPLCDLNNTDRGHSQTSASVELTGVYIIYVVLSIPQLGTVSPIDIYMKFLFLYRVKSWQNSVELRKYLKQISSGPGGQDQAQHIWQLARIPSTWTYKYVLHHIWLSTERNTTLHITYERFRCMKHPKFKFHNYFILLYFYVTFNDIVYTGSCHAQ